MVGLMADRRMRRLARHGRTVRNVLIYAAGVGLAVFGAVAILEVVPTDPVVGWGSLVTGLVVIIVVHERFGGPWPPPADDP